MSDHQNREQGLLLRDVLQVTILETIYYIYTYICTRICRQMCHINTYAHLYAQMYRDYLDTILRMLGTKSQIQQLQKATLGDYP